MTHRTKASEAIIAVSVVSLASLQRILLKAAIARISGQGCYCTMTIDPSEYQ